VGYLQVGAFPKVRPSGSGWAGTAYTRVRKEAFVHVSDIPASYLRRGTGLLARGTFGFTVDPAAAPAGEPASTDLTRLIPAAATSLLLPAALLALRRRARR
jgi:hypothetical protein